MTVYRNASTKTVELSVANKDIVDYTIEPGQILKIQSNISIFARSPQGIIVTRTFEYGDMLQEVVFSDFTGIADLQDKVKSGIL